MNQSNENAQAIVRLAGREPGPAGSSGGGKTASDRPNTFDGKKEHFSEWSNKAFSYVEELDGHKSIAKQCNAILSYLTGKPYKWAEAYLKSHPAATLQEFREALARMYGKPNLALEAEVTLQNVCHRTSVAKMCEELEACFVHLTKSERDKKNMLWIRLKVEFRERMLAHDASPASSYDSGTKSSLGAEMGETYEEYANKLIKLDEIYWNNRLMQLYGQTQRQGNTNTGNRSSSASTSSQSQHSPASSTNTIQRQFPVPARPRHPDDMDVDTLQKEGRCFHCKEKGHLSKNCPKKQQGQKTRAVDIEDLEDVVNRLTTIRLQEARSSGERSSGSSVSRNEAGPSGFHQAA